MVAVIDITYYCSGDTPAGFAMVYMPHEVLLTTAMWTWRDTDTVYQYYTGLLSEGGLYSDAKILGQARERLANILNMQE